MDETGTYAQQQRGLKFVAFLPECVRSALRKAKELPFSTHFPAVVLSCQISGIVGGKGDVLSLEDGVLECIWPDEKENIHHLCGTVLNTALAIQSEFAQSEPKIGNGLRSEIGISVGVAKVVLLGSRNYFYGVIGDVLEEARHSISLCSPGEVVVMEGFWSQVNAPSEYKWKKAEGNHIKVTSTTASVVKSEDIPSITSSQLKSANKDIANEIGKFIHKFYKKARTKPLLQNLAAVSQVVFLAVRIVDIDVECMDRLHQGVNIIDETVQKNEGIITKVIYRKDPVLCLVFGLPGFKHNDDAVRAVQCAMDIQKSIADLGMKASIGISSGTVFCGILGDVPRKECCVLGMPVHTALSIVEKFRDTEIVCDVDVYFRSFRSLGRFFTPVKKRLEDLKHLGLFFKIDTDKKKYWPTVKCIGRREEKRGILEALEKLMKDEWKELEGRLPFILISGDVGAGKANLLNWTLQEGRKLGYRLVARVSNTTFERARDNAWSILRQLLSSCWIDSESKILDLMGKNAYSYPLHLLDKEMNMSFKKPLLVMENENVTEMMVELIKKSIKEPVLIAVENAEYTGAESWLFLQRTMVERVAVVIATFHSDFKCTIPFLQKMIRERYLNISLNPISDDDLGTLACHMLGVDAIHKGLLRFLQEKSEGNPLYIQEILMLPSLQEHYYLVPMSSISEDVLEQNFVFAEIEEDDGIHPTTLEVCNIVDLEGLSSLTVSTNLMDLVRDHATGLNPEEQMLLRKFSLFGETFGLSVLESVFPDYSSDELARKLQNLVEKNILSPACEHWRSTSTGNGSKLSLEEATQVYCIHPLKFVSDYLKRSVHSSVASDQRERLHLYMADLLKNEAGYFCDACRTEGGGRHDRKTIQCPEPFKQCKIPSIDFRLCQCSHIRMDILIQREFHLEKGNAPLAKRVDSLLDAAERGLDAGLPSEVESILGKIQRLKGSRGNVSNVPDYAVIAAKRLRAKAKISKGNIDDALRYLKDAMQNMNIVFPDDIESKAYKSKRFNGRLGSEENRCLCLGCNLLVAFGMHEEATRVAGMLEQFLMQESQENFELISARTVYLRAVTKTEVSKSREKTTFRLIGDIRQQCLKRLSELPVVDVGELEAILTAYATVVRVLFEKAEFDECKDIGHKTFHLLKILNHPRLIVQVLFWITLVHFYAGKNHKKCLELISHMQDAYEQSGDRLSQVIYQTLLIKLMREMKLSMDTSDKLKICMDYAARGCNADSFQTNHDAKIFCLSSLMAIWCLEENLPDPFPSWYNQALKLQRRVHLDNYWSLLGTSYLEMAKIMKKQEKWFALTRSEVDNFKQSFKKVIENLQIHIKKCVPVLGRCVVEIEGILRNAVKDCSGLK